MQKMKMLVGGILCAAAVGAQAYEAGDWIVRAGAATVDPTEDSSTVTLNGAEALGSNARVTVDSDTQLGLTVAYMVTPNVGVELLAATPFSHNINANSSLEKVTGYNDLGDTKQLPPTLSLQYYFNNSSDFTPYVGMGVNYTIFFDEGTSRELQGTLGGDAKMDLENSWGLAAQAGVDYKLADNWLLNAAVWYIDIDTEADITSPAGRVEVDVDVDPWVYMVGVGYKF